MKKLLVLFLLVGHSLAFAQAVTEVTLDDGRTILANADGLTLYTFDQDEDNVSNCFRRCLRIWPPVIVSDSEEVLPPFGVITRDSGELQLTLDSKPLYLYFRDQNVGDILGDNLQGVWHIVPTSERSDI